MTRPKKILITGASGLIGSHLTKLLLKRNDKVNHLGRSAKTLPGIQTFVWDVENKTMDASTLDGVDVIVHLAGANVGEKRWTKKRKQEIFDSRIESTKLLAEKLKTGQHQVKHFICASGIGYYGYADAHTVFTESSPAGSDFLADVTEAWEKEADEIAKLGIRLVKIRTGIALSSSGGALVEIARPVKMYAAAPLGDGIQMVSWIHIDDLCDIYLKAIDDTSMQGAYNAVAPHPVNNRELTREIAKALHKPMFLPPVPGFALNLLLGEMAEIVLKGSNVSPKRISEAGYSFKYPQLTEALRDIFKPEK